MTILYHAIETLMVEWPCAYTTTRHSVVTAVAR